MYLDDTHFTTYALYTSEKGIKPKVYETGNYILKADTCIETQTYGIQPTGFKNVAVHFRFIKRNDSLIFKGILPNGVTVEEYWEKVPSVPPPF
jgi:hypothetical protein